MTRPESHPANQRQQPVPAEPDPRGAQQSIGSDEPHDLGRRRFLAGLAAAAAATAVIGCGKSQAEPSAQASPSPTASPPAPPTQSAPVAAPLPSIQLGNHRLSRLIVGANPFHGFSYLGPHVDQHMKEYFTPERTVEFLQRCVAEGITAHQFSFSAKRKVEYLPLSRERGVTIPFLGLISAVDDIKPAIEAAQPFALVHHGGVTDSLFGQGKSQVVHDFVKAVHDAGITAGVSSHCPDNVKRIADEGWENDFFMTCFYFLSREKTPGAEEKALPVPTLEVSHAFYKDDPMVMTEVIQQVNKPCLGFKILAAGRQCKNQTTVREAFKFAFSRIKPTDGVIVGMYPRFFDEIKANSQYAREFGKLPESV